MRPFFIVSILLVVLNINSGHAQLTMTPPPGINPNNALFQMGYLDVTLLGADPTGNSDATQIIRNAVKLARDYQLVCYFPGGTYLVTDTISCILPVFQVGGAWRNDRRKPCVLEGEPGNRPTLKLGPGAVGYNNPNSPKPVIWMWAARRNAYNGMPPGSFNPLQEQPGIAFNMVFKGINIDISGHPGAEGIRFTGAQGCTLEDVTVNANGAFAGMHSGFGPGGGIFNLQVNGGKYGIYIDNPGFSEQPTYAGLRLYNQETAAFYCTDLWSPAVIVGFHIVKENAPTIGFVPHKGMSMIDGVIELTGTPSSSLMIEQQANKNLYLKNVYVKGAANIAQNLSTPNPEQWTRVKEYGYTRTWESRNIVDGVTGTNTYNEGIELATPNPNEIIAKHLWNEATFPSIKMRNQSNYVNVLDAAKMGGNPAIGNGSADDTDALKYAIDNYQYVFLPKGIYKVNESIRLKYTTQLFGAGKTYSIIRADSSWHPAPLTPLVETIYHYDAYPSLSFLMLELWNEKNANMNHLSWRVGRNSMVRDVMTGNIINSFSLQDSSFHRMYEITHRGGGRWYAVTAEWTKNRPISWNPDYRGFYVEGTTEPLQVYGLNVERVSGSPIAEINNAKNVSIYYYKAESGSSDGGGGTILPSVPLLIKDSENIEVFAIDGLIELINGDGLIEIENSDNITVTNVKSIKTNNAWNNLTEDFYGNTLSFRGDWWLALYKRRAIDVDVSVFLEGAYRPSNGQLSTVLSDRGLLPAQTPLNPSGVATPKGQPFNTAPWNYSGSEGQDFHPGSYSGLDAVDWVLLSFRSGIDKSTEVHRCAGIVQADGQLYLPDVLSSSLLPNGNYYLGIEHRNHLSVLSPVPVTVADARVLYDFRVDGGYSSSGIPGQREVAPGVWALYAGDGDKTSSNGDINGSDRAFFNVSNGYFDWYLAADYNLDGQVDGMDKLFWSYNNGIFTTVD